MALNEEVKHNLLLVVTTILFILFVTGKAIPSDVPIQPVIIT